MAKSEGCKHGERRRDGGDGLCQWGTRMTSDLVYCCFRSIGVGWSEWLSVLAASGGVITRPRRLLSCLQLCHLQLERKGALAFASPPHPTPKGCLRVLTDR